MTHSRPALEALAAGPAFRRRTEDPPSALVQPGGVYEPDPYYEPGPPVGGGGAFVGFMLLALLLMGVGKLIENYRQDGRPWVGAAWVLWIFLAWASTRC